MKIDVTQEDILAGRRNDCTLCPIALAVNRLLPTGWAAYIRRTTAIYDEHGYLAFTVKMPKEAVGFFEVFDATELCFSPHRLNPFSFNLSAEVFMSAPSGGQAE